jgi:glutamate-1-semialdehyde 2,1-aminomutase
MITTEVTLPNLVRSLAFQERAKKRIPGLSQLMSKRPDQFAPGLWPGYYSKANGVNVWDLDGNRYIDMSISGIGANILGYADPDVDTAVIEAIKNGVSCSLNCPEEVELAELLCELHPWAEMVRYSRTGGEAMSIAVRIVRAATGKDKVAFCGYHGWHDWYLAANLEAENTLGEYLLPGLEPNGVPSGLTGTALPFHYNRLDDLKKICEENREELAAIILEPTRSRIPEPGFLSGARDLASYYGAVLIVDEISAGFRMNTGGAHMKFGLEPDVAVFSKALGNGYPIAAIIGVADVMDAAQKSFISSTNWTERTGPTAAIATIKKHQSENAGEHLVRMGEIVQNGWRKSAGRHNLPVHIDGIPPLSHFSFDIDNPLAAKSLLVQLMLERGYLASTLFYSMLAHTENHVKSYLDAIDEAFAHIAELSREDRIEEELVGHPAAAGFTRLT